MKKALIVWGGWDGHQPKGSRRNFRWYFDVKRTLKYTFPIRWTLIGMLRAYGSA